jgi:hypothetical protein
LVGWLDNRRLALIMACDKKIVAICLIDVRAASP